MSFVSYPISEFLLFFIRLVLFFVALISWVAFSLLCSCTRYASTWFAYLDSSSVCFFSVWLWPHNLYLSRMKNQEGHWGYCWCPWVERTAWCEDNNMTIWKGHMRRVPGIIYSGVYHAYKRQRKQQEKKKTCEHGLLPAGLVASVIFYFPIFCTNVSSAAFIRRRRNQVSRASSFLRPRCYFTPYLVM